jgi:RNA polymerase sigma-70 factor (ECF subfamily)
VDTASSQPGELALSLPSAPAALSVEPEVESYLARDTGSGLTDALVRELYLTAEAESCGLTDEEFGAALAVVGEKVHYNLPPGTPATAAQQTAFYRGLRLPELAMAQACARGREAAWERFLSLYRGPLTQAAIAIAGSATLGHDLADSLYAELFGLGGSSAPSGRSERRSPLASYSGRGSLLGWLRTTLAQRHVDHYRRTRRETSLEAVEETQPIAAPIASATPLPAELNRLTQAVARGLGALAAEDRFLLSAYFLDQQTLLQIARLLRVHEATVSRKLKRLTAELRKQLLRELEAGGLSKRAAEEALGADPRDLEINLRGLLQTSQAPPFSDQTTGSQAAASQ